MTVTTQTPTLTLTLTLTSHTYTYTNTYTDTYTNTYTHTHTHTRTYTNTFTNTTLTLTLKSSSLQVSQQPCDDIKMKWRYEAFAWKMAVADHACKDMYRCVCARHQCRTGTHKVTEDTKSGFNIHVTVARRQATMPWQQGNLRLTHFQCSQHIDTLPTFHALGVQIREM